MTPRRESVGHLQLTRRVVAFVRWRIDTEHLLLRPTADVATPAARTPLACLLIDVGTIRAERSVFSAVALGYRHESDSPGFRKVVTPLISTPGGLRTCAMRRFSEAVQPKSSAKQWADVRRRMSPPHLQSVAQISAELGTHVVTLYSWR